MPAIYKDSVGITVQTTLPDWATKTSDASLSAWLVQPDGSRLFKDIGDLDITSWPLIVYTTKQDELSQVGVFKWEMSVTYTGRVFPLDPIQFHVWPSNREGT